MSLIISVNTGPESLTNEELGSSSIEQRGLKAFSESGLGDKYLFYLKAFPSMASEKILVL